LQQNEWKTEIASVEYRKLFLTRSSLSIWWQYLVGWPVWMFIFFCVEIDNLSCLDDD